MKTLIRHALLTFVVVAYTLTASHASIATLFSPNDKPTKKLIEFINEAQKTIYAAQYLFTDKTIAEALIKAKARNIDIKIILDPISTDSKYGKAELLTQNNIAVFVFNPHPNKKGFEVSANDKWFSNTPIMHNKFVIIDNTLVWTGSFNWTVAANTRNSENVLYTNDRQACKSYSDYFADLLATKCIPYAAHIAAQNKTPSSSLRQDVLNCLHTTNDDASLLNSLINLLEKQHISAKN